MNCATGTERDSAKGRGREQTLNRQCRAVSRPDCNWRYRALSCRQKTRRIPLEEQRDEARLYGVREEAHVEVNSIVIVSLVSPKEKMWGQILQLEPKGVTVRGVELDSFDDFIRQVIQQEETAVGLNTVFFPMQRVERIMVDEPSGSIPSLSQRFQSKVGLTIQEYLGIDVPHL